MTTTWRTYNGAEYSTVTAIPCSVIANGRLIGLGGDPINEDHPELSAEIDRRGRAVYRNHAGIGVVVDGPVIGCDHSERPTAFGLPNVIVSDAVPPDTIVVVGSCICPHSVLEHRENGCQSADCGCTTPSSRLASTVRFGGDSLTDLLTHPAVAAELAHAAAQARVRFTGEASGL